MRIVGNAVLRAIVVIGVPFLVIAWLDRGEGASANADIGGGAIVLLLIVVISAVWCGLDAFRRPTPEVLRIWAGVAVLVVVAVLLRSVATDQFTVDLIVVLPLFAGVVAVPAFIGALVGDSLRRSRL